MTKTILDHINAGTLLREDWGDGRETACLYSALVPGATSTKGCPAEIMPQWLADVTPYLDDNGTKEAWRGLVTRYGEASQRWHVISADRWEYVRRQLTADCLKLALDAASTVEHGHYWPVVQSACTSIVDTLRDNQDPTPEQREAAEAAAWVAEAEAAEAAEAAAWAAARAAWAAWAADAAAWTADAAAWDSIFDMLMTRIEAEIGETA